MRVAVIPARGGSKRVPRKNARIFHGRPMITWSIEAAKRSGCFERIMVSTDDPEIAEIAATHGADVPFRRPDALSDDHATTTDVIAHATRWCIESGSAPSLVCCIYATAPFVQVDDLRRGFELISGGDWRFVFSATSFGFPIFRGIRVDAAGRVGMFFPEHFSTRSQDLPESLHDAGQFYWGRPEAWLRGDRIFDSWSTIVELPRWRVQDIDTDEDWKRAELLAQMLLVHPSSNADVPLTGAHSKPPSAAS